MPIDPGERGRWLLEQLGTPTQDTVHKLLWTGLILLLVLLTRRLFLHFIRGQDMSSSAHYRWRKFAGWGSIALLLAAIGPIWLGGAGDLLTYFGLLSAGVAVALRDPLANFFGWAFILTRSPFDLGDRIEIDGTKGDVVDQRLLEFTVMEVGNWVDSEQSTGRVVHIPNARVFLSPLANYTQGFDFLWHEIEQVVSFESNWHKAKDILQRIADEQAAHHAPVAETQMRQASSRFYLAVGTLTPKVYTRLRPYGIGLTIRYLTPVRRRRTTEELLVEALLEAFAREPDIQLAYPSQRIFYNPREGKPGSGGPPGPGEPAAPDEVEGLV